jgi:hypothetical protein
MFLKLPLEKAAIWSLLMGWLLLPSGMVVNPPLLPPLDRDSIPAMSTFLLCCMKGSEAPAPRRSAVIYLLALTWVIAPLFASLGNSYEIQIGNRSLPGFYPLDASKIALDNLITLAPFFVGMRYLSTDSARASLLKALPAAALFYSIPMLFEIRMSPQLHRWVYGFHPHSFQQQVRDGGFRPVVFLGHGLVVALFMCMAVIAAIAIARARWQIFRKPASWVAAYLAVMLLLCKTLGATIYVIIAGPLVWFTSPRTWVRVSVVISLVVCAYPLLRTYDIVPVHRVLAAANSFDPERAASFKTRITNEDRLLARGNEKPFFGWGAWGRNRVYDQGTGEDISITDGGWIMQFGAWGWLGYLSYFGLFAASVLRSRRAVRGPVTRTSSAVGGLSLLVAGNLFDMVPNASLLPFTYLAAGSIAGAVRVRATNRNRRLVQKREPVVVASEA